MPTKSRSEVRYFCESTISVFDPPTHMAASLREALARFTRALPRVGQMSERTALLGLAQESHGSS